MPKLVDTWFCTECAKAGRPFVYVDKRERVCPFGHKSKTRNLTDTSRARKEHHGGS